MAFRQVETFTIKVEYYPDENMHTRVLISTNDCPFMFWMCACEYLMHKTAQNSNVEYEKVMELLVKGAMAYKDQVPKDNCKKRCKDCRWEKWNDSICDFCHSDTIRDKPYYVRKWWKFNWKFRRMSN